MLPAVFDFLDGPVRDAVTQVYNAVGYLGHYQEPRATSALLAASKAADPAIRSAAISSLGEHAVADGATAAILAALIPGNYTAIMRGVGDTTGIALVEAYHLD